MNDIYRGSQGWQGYQGVIGYQGATGRGFQGFQGDFGEDGDAGAQGFQGFQGLTGSGAQGFQGFQGLTGSGAQGAQGFQGGGSALTTDALTSSAAVDLDFNGAPRKTLLLAHATTLSVSNRGANKSFELFLEGDTGGPWGLTYDAAWKNVGGTGLPTSIATGQVMKFRFDCLGVDAAHVRIEYVNGAGVDYAFTASAAISIHKSGSASFNPISGTMTGGPGRGWLLKTINVSAGTFTGSFGSYITTQTVDVDTGRLTAVQWLALTSTSQQADYAVTWFPTEIASVGQVCNGTLSWSIQDGVESAGDNLSLTAYGADEVQQLQWTNTGTPTAPTGGAFTLYHSSYGTTAPQIEVAGGTSAIQAALTALMGAAAPTVGGDMTTTTFTFSNGALAHTDTVELVVGGGSPGAHDSTGNGAFSFTKIINGDGVSNYDTYNGTWGASDIGTVTFDGTVWVRGSSSTINIGGIIYGMSDFGTTFALTAPDFVDRGTISATPNLGFTLTGTMSTTTVGNS